MRNLLPAMVLALAAAGVPASVGAAEMKSDIGAGEGQLDIVAWPGYIERGETDKKYDWVTDFEKKTGCKVNVKTAGTSDEMVALMNEGGFDLVTASGDASLRLIAGKRVQPINVKLIPSYSTVDERLQKAPWHTVGEEHYGVPYQWGANVLAYNTKVFPGAPKSWSVVFEEQTLPDGKSNKGRVQAFDGPIYIADAALYLMSKKPELGIKDPYELTEEQYKAALELLRVQRKLVGRYWHDAMVQIDDFKNEGVAASSSWPFQVNLLKGEKQPIASTIPEEGATGWADTTMMHSEASHPNCAYMWLEHSISPKLQGDLASWFGSVPAVPAACKGNELLGPEGCATNGSEDFGRIKFWRTPVAKCAAQSAGCVPYYRWVSDYIAVLGGR
jgi:putative spermidine/putrescine transport system substrate-binding protein